MKILLFPILLLCFFSACSSDPKSQQNEIRIKEPSQNEIGSSSEVKSNIMISRPSNVLLTGHPEHRLVTVHKLNFNSNGEEASIDGNFSHHSYAEHLVEEYNSWHGHYLPGLEAIYGSGLINVAHYQLKTRQKNNFFERPVLINTLYYPSLYTDTLNNKPIFRNYYLASVYDEDTNRDSTINLKDLRRFYHFDLDGITKTPLIPANYSVMSSEYDPKNDLFFIFAKLDKNANGQREVDEPVHVFWIDLKRPKPAERLY